MSDQSSVAPMVRIEASLTPRLNLAFHQNSVPFLRELVIVTGQRFHIPDLDLALDAGLLSRLTFPSPVTEDRAVSFHHVGNGAYEKGGARIAP